MAFRVEEPWQVRARRGRAAARPHQPRQPAAVEPRARRHRARHRHGAERDVRVPRGLRVPRRARPGEFRVRATVGEHPEYDRELFDRPVPARIWDELFLEKYQIGSSLLRRSPPARVDRGAAPLPARAGPRTARPGRVAAGDDLLVPLFDKERELMGVLDLYDPADRALPTLELVKSLEVFATHAAVAIENARQYEQLEHTTRGARGAARPAPRHHRGERGAALDAGRARAPQPDRGAAQGDRRLRRDGGPARRRGRARAVLRLRRPTPTTSRSTAGARRSTSASPAGCSSTTRRSWSTTCSTTRAGRWCRAPSGSRRRRIIAPLTVGGKAIGVLALDRMGERTFADSELEPTKLFANLAAIAMQNARQYERLEQTSGAARGPARPAAPRCST